jgi:hypothetical protein
MQSARSTLRHAVRIVWRNEVGAMKSRQDEWRPLSLTNPDIEHDGGPAIEDLEASSQG